VEDLVSGGAPTGRLPDPDFWRGRRVLLTGHTGFKGAWLSVMLAELGAEVSGFALPPEPGPTAYDLLDVPHRLAEDRYADLRDAAAVQAAVAETRPQMVFHLGAQAIVSRGLRDPRGTFRTNVEGSVNLLDALARRGNGADAIVVTSDKVYRPGAAGHRHTEDDALGGGDPYSASKAACEHAVDAYRHLPTDGLRAIATVRAGNVIGGGDFAEDRLIPDLVRADQAGRPVQLRRPSATRPFQHVLDVLVGYILAAEHIAAGDPKRAFNFGPADGELAVAEMIKTAEAALGRPLAKEVMPDPPFEEANRLALDSGLATRVLGWQPRNDIRQGVAMTFGWYRAWQERQDMAALSRRQVVEALSQ
jgi:CDP-glucose 4,6-dehydratase